MSEYGMIFSNTDIFYKGHICVLCCYVISYVYGQSNKTESSQELRMPETSDSSTFINFTDGKTVEITTINSLTTSSSDQTTKPELTPADRALFTHLREQGLYYDLKSIMDDINTNKLKTGIVDLMSVHNRSAWITRMRQNYQSRDQLKKKKRMAFINVETIYSSKREMITKAVARRMRGRHMTSPPKFMSDIRVILGPGTARKLYYSLTKYSTAHHINQVLNTQTVVLERFWLHHAAFTIGKAFNQSELPPRGHPIYKWPEDLMAPDVLFFINATKDSKEFNQEFTPFTERLIEVYRRVDGVKVVELNPSLNYLTIVKYIINYVIEHFKDHPDIMVPSIDAPRAIKPPFHTNR